MVDQSGDDAYKRLLIIVNAQLGLTEEARKVLAESGSSG